MNTDDARSVLKAHLERYRPISYAGLVPRIDHSETEIVPQAQGGFWQLQVQFFWDGAPGQDIRVMGAMDDGGAWCVHASLREFHQVF